MKAIVSLKKNFTSLTVAAALTALALAVRAQMPAALGNLPLYFTAASGPTNHPAQFVAQGGDSQFLISPVEAQFNLQKSDAATREISSRTVRMRFVGANSRAQILGKDELPGKINYLVGNNPSQWQTGMATFARLRVEQLYPGVNLTYYGNQRQLEYDLAIAPGVNPDAIQIRFGGVDKTSIGAQGELILALGKDEIDQPKPVIYQVINGQRQVVSGGYRLVDAHTVAFAIGKYDGRLPLVIDPVLSFSTYFGGNGNDTAWSVALDTNGFIYIAGDTLSSQFPTNSRPNGYQTNFSGGGITGDAFVAKFDNQGSNLVYFTFLGGNADDQANSIFVNGSGDAFVTGFTDSANFPTTTNALSRTISGISTPAGYSIDAFVAELNPGGSNLLYSTYLGGSGPDAGEGIALDSANNIYIAGYTGSANFPTTPNAFQKHLACPYSIYTTYLYANAFVAEISASGTNLLYSSYLGGTNLDVAKGIAIDSSSNVYVTGFTGSTNFPATNAISQQFVQTNTVGGLTTNFVNGFSLNGGTNAFVAKFAPGCASLIYSTFLGGANKDEANGIAVDGSGNAYVTGWTVSTNFPNTVAISNLYNGLTNNLVYGSSVTTNVFLTQITWDASSNTAAIGYSAIFGGTNFGGDVGNGITLDPSGNIFVVGASTTTNFPAVNTPGLLGTTNAGGSDIFVIGFSTTSGTNGASLSSIIYSGYLGGAGNDYGYGIAVDSFTNVYIAGQTASADFPTLNSYQSSLKGSSDAFLTKIGWVNVAPQITQISLQPTNELVEVGTNLFVEAEQFLTFNSTVTGTPPLFYHWQLNGANLTGTNVFGATNATMNIRPLLTNDSGSFRLIVSNYAGFAVSSNIILTVTKGPLITQQPTNLTVGVGATASFTMNGYATAPFHFQWLRDGTYLTNETNASGSVISGATNFNLVISNTQTNDEGDYWFILTNKWGSVTSSVATLTVVAFPTIITSPTNRTVAQGSTVTFVVGAMGTTPLSYQWQKNGNNLLNSGHISGVNNSALTISSALTNDNGAYSVIVTDSVGSVTSSPPAILTVLTAPVFGSIATDTNGDLILSGVGNISGNTYYVLTSTNLATPLAQWTPIATNQFGNQGQFTFTNAPFTNSPQQFYLIQVP